MFEESLHNNVDQGSVHNVQEMKNLPMYWWPDKENSAFFICFSHIINDILVFDGMELHLSI